MYTDVQIIEGGKRIKTEKKRLKLVKEFNNDVVLYETEGGRAVIYFKKRDEYVLVSIDMA
ncbi:MAG TPA: hypothetical protein ENH45_01270 [Nitrospirae bacterium]|nr:hypothetical protein BMS3Abin09_00425 [bacterium BMS3Abin09]GBE41696.1 hypothetical protein BMS3Bbin09_01604 [bacterium BMS3Bbin09]HDH34766.1 hypothetical protein [Nitrospirota bacterium]HDZ83824.1 hypothetical protein [Nitrospirota bacterium]